MRLRVVVFIAAVAMVATAIVAFLVVTPSAPQDDHEASVSARDRRESNPHPRRASRTSDIVRLERPSPSSHADPPRSDTARSPAANEEVDLEPPDHRDAPLEENASPTTDAVPDGGTVAGAAISSTEWRDPVNERVLGPRAWMAPISDEENARIDEIFERARAARHDPRLSPRDRRTAIETARPIVDGCVESLRRRRPGAEGRLILAWESSASGGRGTIRNVRITVNVKLDDPEFERCVLTGLEGRTFPAEDGETRLVEYPFFYDGN